MKPTLIRAQTIHQWFEAQASRTPDVVAVVFEDARLTYAELNARANQVAHALRTRGVGLGIRVGLCLERSLELIVGLLAILKAGAAYVPVEPTLPPERLAFLLHDADVAGMLTHAAARTSFLSETLAALHSIKLWDFHALCEEAIAPMGEENLPAPHPQNQAYLIYTSGSTGQPKGVAVSHRALVSYVSSVLTQMAVPESATQWALLSTVAADLGHTMLFGSLCAGRTLHLLSTDRGFHPEQMVEYMQRAQINVLKLTPSHLAGLLDATHPEQVLPKHCLVLGGEALPWSLVGRIQALAPHCAVINHYGPTETTVGALTHRIEPQVARQGVTVPIGRPLAHSRVYILDRRLEPVPVGVPGELYLGGPGVAQGYHGQPGLTAERFMPDPFGRHAGERLYRTGDQARYQEDGTIEFLGRRDQQVKLRGYRIELGEIEARLCAEPEVRDAVVALREGPAETKRLVAYVVATADSEIQVAALKQRLAQQLPDYMVPHTILVLDALPLTQNGKLDRTALPDPEQDRESKADRDASPRTNTEQALAEIWAQVLRREQVRIHDNFFDLGGDSILSLQIIARAHQRGLKLTPKQLFEQPTVAGLAAVAVFRGQDSSAAPVNVLVTGTVPLTPIQQWFFDAQHPNPHHWNQAVLLTLEHPLELPLLKQAVDHLVAHHDALRMRFLPREEGRWEQQYAATEPHPLCHDIDLRHAAQTWQVALEEALDTEATRVQRNLDLSRGPLLQAAYFDLGVDAPGRLLLVAHHLVVDGVSWRVLLEDLETACRQLEQGQPVVLPAKTTSVKAWMEHLCVYGDSEELRGELDYWLAEENQTSVGLPLDVADGENQVGNAKIVSVNLSPEETRALLQEVPLVYRTDVSDLLLAALAQTLCRWTGQPSVRVEVEGHGREDLFEGVDLSRTVGWFTTRFPVCLTPGEAGPEAAIKACKAQLRQVPKKGIGYGLLRYLTSSGDIRTAIAAVSTPQVMFNYLGQLDLVLDRASLFSLADESTGLSRDQGGQRPYLLDIDSCVLGDHLQIDWRYSASVHNAATVESLAQSYIEALRDLIAHCLSRGPAGSVR